MSEFYTPEKDKASLTSIDEVQEGLPSLLIIGDSISQGYTIPVRKRLRGKWNVYRAKANCGNTAFGLQELDKWTGNQKWDLIHFNWGLHDLCYRHPDSQDYGNRDKVNGSISIPIEQYRENLEVLVKRLKEKAAQLIWASTTIVPPGEVGRYEGDDLKYNTVAEEIMHRHGVPVNDLHALTADFPVSHFVAEGDVHFTDNAYEVIAAQVVESINKITGADRES